MNSITLEITDEEGRQVERLERKGETKVGIFRSGLACIDKEEAKPRADYHPSNFIG